MVAARILLNILCALFIVCLYSQADIKEELYEIAIVEEKVMMPMRDGIRLSTNIYRPKTEMV